MLIVKTCNITNRLTGKRTRKVENDDIFFLLALQPVVGLYFAAL